MLKVFKSKIAAGALCAMLFAQHGVLADEGPEEIASPTGLRTIVMKDPVPVSDFFNPDSSRLIQNFLSGLTVGGYYRGYFYSRKMTDPYGNYGTNKAMSVGDGYYDPMLFLYLGGNPTPTTSFGTEVIVLNPFLAYTGPSKTYGNIAPFFNMVLRGGFNTKIGNFNVVAGGIEWMALTPFTFGDNVGFNRYSLFERRPWDPVGNIKNRYAGYYYNGTINQDTRFGTRAFKGFMLSGTINKINTNIDVFYGKTPNNGGINRENYVKPSGNLGVRIKKNLKNNNYISLNTFNNYIKLDSVNAKYDVQWNIITTEFNFNYKGIIWKGEVGAGRYMSPSYPESWGEGIITDLIIPKKITKIPLSLRYFQIGNSFTSNVANFSNTTIREVTTGYANGTIISGIAPFGAGVNSVGDLANNRRGAALNTDIRFWKVVLTLGTQISTDLKKLDSNITLTYGHKINGLKWSRLPGIFPLNGTFGPNNRVGTYYRGAYERMTITELNGSTLAYKRHYNSLDAQLKFRNKIFNKDFYLFYLGQFNSVQNRFSPITVFDDGAYVRVLTHEMDIYYQLTPSFILAFYAGLERIHGNQYTDLGPNGKPRDQTGQGLGAGFDLSISNQTTLFFRQRWFSYEDKNFPGEKFNGHEGTIEVKIFF